MMLFKISMKNIARSVKDYAIYFFTLVLGVAIFYVFNAIESQTVMLEVSRNTAKIIKMMTTLLSGVSVFVSFILGFLIIYASRFLIKRRNKEFGVYLTLGMGKRKISLILFFETLIIGIISLVIGLLIGVALSQIMSVFVANMFDADMTKFQFIFSGAACVKTLIYFGIIYLLVMVFNTIIISKCKLIDMLNAGKKTEQIKAKNPVICIIVFLVAISMIGYAYYLVTGGIKYLDTEVDFFKPIVLGAVGTFLLFWSLSGLLLKIVMSMKKVYLKGLNSFVVRQVSSKINTAVCQLTIICLMLFVTICVLSSAFSIKKSMSDNLKELAPVDVQLIKNLDYFPDNKDIVKDDKLSIYETLKVNGFKPEKKFKDVLNFDIYETDELTMEKSLGSSAKEIKKNFPYIAYSAPQNIVKLSDYNKIAKRYGNESLKMNQNEYAIIGDFQSMVSIRNIPLSYGQTINIKGRELKPKFKKCKYGYIEISGNHSNDGVFILPDDVVESMEKKAIGIIADYNIGSKDGKRKIEDELNAIVKKIWMKTSSITINSKIDIAEAGTGISALVTFLGLYLGIIFMISSTAVIALKELSESSDNRERYIMLRKLGADDKMINNALLRQIGIFFVFPLLIAIVHSVVGIHFCNYVLEVIGRTGLLPSIIMTGVFLIVIYGGYFLITYFCSKNIIKEK